MAEKRYIIIKQTMRMRVRRSDAPWITVEFHHEGFTAGDTNDTELVRTYQYNRLKDMSKLPRMIYNFIMNEEMPSWDS